MASAPNPKHTLHMGPREWAVLLLLSVIWGASFIFFRVMVRELAPFTIVLGRLSIAALALNLFLLTQGERMRFSTRDWGRFAVLGLVNNVLPFTLIATSETHITAGMASMLLATVPMGTTLLAHIFTHDEKLAWNKLAGVGLGLVGVALLIGPDALAGFANADFVGDLTCLSATVTYSIGSIYSRRFHDIPPLKAATGQVTMGSLLIAPFALLWDKPWTLGPLSAATWGSLLSIALIGTALAYILFFRLIAKAGAVNVSLVTQIQPISTVVLGWLLLDEGLGLNAVAGMAVISLGLACIDGRILRIGRARPA